MTVASYTQIPGTISPSDTSMAVHALVLSISEKFLCRSSKRWQGPGLLPPAAPLSWGALGQGCPCSHQALSLHVELPVRVPISANRCLLSTEVGLLLCNSGKWKQPVLEWIFFSFFQMYNNYNEIFLGTAFHLKALSLYDCSASLCELLDMSLDK